MCFADDCDCNAIVNATTHSPCDSTSTYSLPSWRRHHCGSEPIKDSILDY
eukprot:m.455830 g.455830  ORF g.455830 m.455830 type:complete len:50 (-) comp21573_c0_seq32:176-325(-)